MNEQLGELLLFGVTAVIVPLLVDEFADWMPWTARQLVTRAARRLPPSGRDRYEEEWLAEMATLPGGKLNQIRFGFAIFWGSFSLKKALNEAPMQELMQSLHLDQLSPVDFEHLVGRLFAEMGYQSRVVGGAGDGGVDIIARDPDPIIGGRVVVQVKKCRHVVGIEQVRALLWAAQKHRAAKAIFVTTSDFGSVTCALADDHKYLRLVDGFTLRKLVAEHLRLDLRTDPPDKPK